MKTIIFNTLLFLVIILPSQCATSLEITSRKLTLKTDHFSTDSRVWNLTYFVNDKHYKPGGPILLHINPAGEFSISGNLLEDIAKNVNGYLVAAGTRYFYGNQPTDSVSLENLKYLTTEQILQDYADLVIELRSNIRGLSNSKAVSVGNGVYGAYASWFRAKYPELCDGAWAIGAAVKARLFFSEFNEDVGESLVKYGSGQCYDRIYEAFNDMNKMFKHNGEDIIKYKFNLCDDVENYNDQQAFLYQIVEYISSIVQMGTKNQIKKTCEEITDSNLDAVSAIAKFVYHKRGGQDSSCLRSAYQDILNFYKNTDWTSPAADSGGRQFMYQQCNELGWAKITTSLNQPFVTDFSSELFSKACSDIFGEGFSLQEIVDKMESFNKRYGGITPDVTNVYYTFDDVNPFKSLAVLDDLNDSTFSDVLEDENRGQELESISDYDSDGLLKIKTRAFGLISEWLQH